MKRSLRRGLPPAALGRGCAPGSTCWTRPLCAARLLGGDFTAESEARRRRGGEAVIQPPSERREMLAFAASSLECIAMPNLRLLRRHLRASSSLTRSRPPMSSRINAQASSGRSTCSRNARESSGAMRAEHDSERRSSDGVSGSARNAACRMSLKSSQPCSP